MCSVSPTLVERYVLVAGRVARLATGLGPVRPYATTHDIAKDGSIKNSGRPAYNERMSDRLPMGSRGGGVLDYYARAGGTYEVAGWLNANTNNEADRMTEDRVSLKVPLKAGAHTIGLAFRHTIAPDESVQTLRNTTDKVPLPTQKPVMIPLDLWVDGARAGDQRPLLSPEPALFPAELPARRDGDRRAGPLWRGAQGVARHAQPPPHLPVPPHGGRSGRACARRIIATLARHAYRRPVGDADIAP
jgi:hypothetical protein